MTADAFGNALGNSIVAGMGRSTTTGASASNAGTTSDATDALPTLGAASGTTSLLNNQTDSAYQPATVLSPDEQRNLAANQPDPVAVMELQQALAQEEFERANGHGGWSRDTDGALRIEIARGANDLPTTSGSANALSTAGQYAVGGAETLLSGMYHYGVRLAGGLASIPYLLDSADAAVAVQAGFADRYNYNVRSQGAHNISAALQPVAQYVQNNVLNPLRDYSTAHIGDAATTTLFAGAQAGFEVGGLLLGGGALGASERVVAGLAPITTRTTSLAYDISKWGEYGLPSDAYFVRTLTERQFVRFNEGRSFDFGGAPVEEYQNGMGFIGSAEEVRGITTGAGYKDALKLNYEPKYVLEFQLQGTAGLQNVIKAPYPGFRYGGQTGAGFSEWNYPGITSQDIVNSHVRVLK